MRIEDASQLIADAAGHAFRCMQGEFTVLMLDASLAMMRPSVLYRPTLSVDGNRYCALYGEDLMQGAAGFGETAEAAMADFDKNWREMKAPAIGRVS